MVRPIICDEGVDIPPNIFIIVGAIWWEEGDRIPLTDPHFNIIGQATDLKREGNVITAELNCDIPPTYKCSMEISDVELHVFKGFRFVTSGRLREVNIFPVDPPLMTRGEINGKETQNLQAAEAGKQ